jgi:hypothetical protein
MASSIGSVSIVVGGLAPYNFTTTACLPTLKAPALRAPVLAWLEPPVITCGLPHKVLLHVQAELGQVASDILDLEGSLSNLVPVAKPKVHND